MSDPAPAPTPGTASLSGVPVAVTAARKAEEQAELLRRRGAEVLLRPLLAPDPAAVDVDRLLQVTREVIDSPPDIVVATTGTGVRAWFMLAERHGLADELRAAFDGAEILARGPKSVGALNGLGLRADWSPASEAFDDVLDRLLAEDPSGRRILLQEHGQSLAPAAARLEERGAEVTVATIYRVVPPEDPEPARRLLGELRDGTVGAVTFTSAMAVEALLLAAADAGVTEQTRHAFVDGVLACCVGQVTASAFGPWQIETVVPDRARLVAMVRALERRVADDRGEQR